ncbi:MAG: class I SAM-dependent methyltransferase [Firmicutes bacterium]|nr:class I SAM-dependent methyltransferase [Bacillota bacterium]
MDQTIDDKRAVFFDKLAETWDTSGPSPAATLVRAFLKKLNLTPGSIILDVGTGTGMMVPYLFELEPEKVMALDLSEVMLSKLRAKYETHYGAELIVSQGDVHFLSLPDASIDAAICNGVYPHFDNKPKALAELLRVLKAKGIIAINHFTNKAFINKVHGEASDPLIRKDLLEPVEDLANLVIKAGFNILDMADNEHEYYLIAEKV